MILSKTHKHPGLTRCKRFVRVSLQRSTRTNRNRRLLQRACGWCKQAGLISGLTRQLTADLLYRQSSAWLKTAMNQGGTA